MQSVPREWLDFLRQQFPKDSRIQLTEIGGNPRPISPGSTGKLDYIDDAGQFHVKWDNGCTLALVLGEDRFSVYLPEPQTFKLYILLYQRSCSRPRRRPRSARRCWMTGWGLSQSMV